MKRFKEIYQWCCEPRQLFFLFIIVLAIPNVALFFTEQMPLLVRICNIILPVSVYWMVMTLSRKPGKIIWILFPFVFFAAFSIGFALSFRTVHYSSRYVFEFADNQFR